MDSPLDRPISTGGAQPSAPPVERKTTFRKTRLAPGLALVCVVLLGAWMGNANGGYLVGEWTPPALILSVLVLLTSLLGFTVSSTQKWSVLALGLLTAYTAWTFASMLWSPNMGNAWLGAGQTLFYLLIFWVVVSLVGLGASRRWVLIASVLGPSVLAAFTLQALYSRFDTFFEGSLLVGTVGYHNGEAAMLLVPFWVAIYLGGSRLVNPFLRGAVLAGAVLCLDLAVLAQSRGAMVAMLVSLPVFFLVSGQRLRGLISLLPLAVALLIAFPGLNSVYLALLDGKDAYGEFERVLPVVWMTATGAGLYGLSWGLIDQRWRPPRMVVRVAGGAALVAVAGSMIFGAMALHERVGDPVVLAEQKWEAFKTNDSAGKDQSRYLSASGTGRYTIWEVAWKDFAAHPILGVGTQNYEATYYQLRDQNTGSLRQPHSLPLEVLGERGIVGGALLFGFLVVCTFAGLRERFRNLLPEGSGQVAALAAAVTYWFVQSSAEWFWQLPAVTLPAFVYLALLVSPWRRPGSGTADKSVERTLRMGGVSLAVLAVATIVPLYAADQYSKQSSNADNPNRAIAAVEQAQRYNPLDPSLPEREAELAIDAGDWSRVESSYERMASLDPEHYAPLMYRAAYYEHRGELGPALNYYEKALLLNPHSEELQISVRQLRNMVSAQ